MSYQQIAQNELIAVNGCRKWRASLRCWNSLKRLTKHGPIFQGKSSFKILGYDQRKFPTPRVNFPGILSGLEGGAP